MQVANLKIATEIDNTIHITFSHVFQGLMPSLRRMSSSPPVDMSGHRKAFYDAMESIDAEKGFNKRIMDDSKYGFVLSLLKRVEDGTSLAQIRWEGHRQVDKYFQKYIVHHFEGDGDVLLERPPKTPDGSVQPLDQSRRVCSYEKVFDCLKTAHGDDHPKGMTLYHRVNASYVNIPRDTCKIFTETCPRCIERKDRKTSVAGHQPILTSDFGTRGQIDLIDFQNSPDGEFKFLLTYIDHGTKIAFSTAMTSKRATAVARVLLDMFTIIGPPSILQSDNGREFSGVDPNTRSIKLNNEVSHFV